MKLILALSAFFLALACSNLQTTTLDNRMPTAYSSSELLREIIVNDSTNRALVKDVGRKCSQSLAEVYNEGKTLKRRISSRLLGSWPTRTIGRITTVSSIAFKRYPLLFLTQTSLGCYFEIVVLMFRTIASFKNAQLFMQLVH